jgi:hypothetical protein
MPPDFGLILLATFLTGSGMYVLHEGDSISPMTESPIATLHSNDHTKIRHLRSVDWETANEGRSLYWGDLILTGRSEATVTFEEGIEVKLSEETLVQLDQPGDGSLTLLLVSGKMSLRKDHAQVLLRGERVEARISKTDFNIENRGKKAEISFSGPLTPADEASGTGRIKLDFTGRSLSTNSPTEKTITLPPIETDATSALSLSPEKTQGEFEPKRQVAEAPLEETESSLNDSVGAPYFDPQAPLRLVSITPIIKNETDKHKVSIAVKTPRRPEELPERSVSRSFKKPEILAQVEKAPQEKPKPVPSGSSERHIDESENGAPTSQLLDLQIGVLGTIQRFESSNWVSLAPRVSWTPRYSLTYSDGIRLDVGLALITKVDGGLFPSLDYVILYSRNFYDHFQIEIGGGLDSWIDYGGTNALARVNGAYLLSQSLLGSGLILDRISVSYSAIFSSAFTQTFFFGVGLSF